MPTNAPLDPHHPPPVSHQTVRLRPGRHESPREGACTLELSSMLAGERFSDHPRAVCPVIASFLRGYNDRLDARRRRDLHAVAALVVGTRAGEEVAHRRALLMHAWAEGLRASRSVLERALWPAVPDLALAEAPNLLGAAVAQAIPRVDDRVHSRTLTLLDVLSRIGPRDGRRDIGWVVNAPGSVGTHDQPTLPTHHARPAGASLVLA